MTATHEDLDSSSTEAAIVLGLGAIVVLTVAAIAMAKAADMAAPPKKVDVTKILKDGSMRRFRPTTELNLGTLHTGDPSIGDDADPSMSPIHANPGWHLAGDTTDFHLGLTA